MSGTTAIRIVLGRPGWPFDEAAQMPADLYAAGNAIPGDDEALWPVSLALDPIAAMPPDAAPVTAVTAVVTSSVGTSGADAMNVPAATTTFHVTGAGIRIGILSDSFDAQGLAV